MSSFVTPRPMPYHRTCPQDVPKMDDAGAGEIWMIIRSVLVRDAEGVVLIITTDLPVVSRTGFGVDRQGH